MARTKGPRYYTTSKSARHFVGKITELVQDHGAESVMIQQRNGEPAGVAFSMVTPKGPIALKVEPDVDAIQARLEEENVAHLSNTASADAVAWAQTYHLLELQLEAVENGVARASEVLGGYVLTDSGATIADLIEQRTDELFSGERLLLPGG